MSKSTAPGPKAGRTQRGSKTGRSASEGSNPIRRNAQHRSGQRPPIRPSSPPLNDQIMRQARFLGKLHRGLVSDSSLQDVCPIKQACGGCTYVNTDYATSLTKKFNHELAILAEAGVTAGAKILDPVPSPNPTAYRALFKLAVRPFRKSSRQLPNFSEGPEPRFALGLFEPGTHRIGPSMTVCPLHVAPLQDLLRDIESELELTELEPWDEESNKGDLRYIAARASHVTGEIMLTWIVSRPVKAELLKLTQRLRRLDHKINAAFMSIHKGQGNAIFGGELVHVAGGVGLRENICDLDVEISPEAFFQVNPWQANNLYRRVELHAGSAGPQDVAWDLYTGTGQIGLILARSGYKTIAVEEIPEAVEDARKNAQRNKLDKKIEFISSRVEDSETKLPIWSQSPKFIVVNPSRRGLHESARSHLAHVLKANRDCKFIYVSCDATTMARDLKDLCKSGHRVRQIEAFDMFAQTDKLEWIVVLTV